MKSKSIDKCTPEISLIASELGGRIRAARIRRKLRQEDLATMAGISRSSIQAVERGEITCSIGALFSVLWSIGLSNELSFIADPGLDRDGLTLSLSDDKKRVYIPRKVDNEF